MHILNQLPLFLRKSKKLVKKDHILRVRIYKTTDLLRIDPFAKTLKTHKVTYIDGAPRYSSRVTGNLRIIWDFQDGEMHIIDLIDIGGHSGGSKIYQ